MERAVFITKARDLEQVTERYDRLYYGIEFCERLIPRPKEIERVVQYCRTESLELTLVTPFVTDEGLNETRRALDCLSPLCPEAEIVINDWGVLRVVRREYDFTRLALGRLLTKQKRGPRLMNLVTKNRMKQLLGHPREPTWENLIESYRMSNVTVPAVAKVLAKHGVERVELDNVLQGVDFRPPAGLVGSLYVPYVYVSVKRWCYLNTDAAGRQETQDPYACKKQCQKRTFQLECIPEMPVRLFVKGNTTFYQNHTIPEDLPGIDRIVYQPNLPH